MDMLFITFTSSSISGKLSLGLIVIENTVDGFAGMPYKRKATKAVKRKPVVRKYKGKRKMKTKSKAVVGGVQRHAIIRGINPFAERYWCKMLTPFRFYIPAAAAPSNGYVLVWANGLYLPYTTAGNDFLSGFGGTACTNYNISEPPAGMTRLCNLNLYTDYRVHSSSIKITATATAAADQFQLCVTPLTGNSTATSNMRLAQVMPFAKKRMVVNNTSGVAQVLTNHVKARDALGMTKEQYVTNAQTSNVYSGNPSAAVYWMVNLSMDNNVTNTGVLQFDVQLTQYVELFNLNAPQSITQ